MARTVALGNEGPVFAGCFEGDFINLDGALSELGLLASELSQGAGGTPQLFQLATRGSDELVASEDSVEDPGSLLDLLLLFDRAGLAPMDLEVPGGVYRHPVLRLLMYRRFLDEIEPRIADARPRYVEQTARLTAPRGRLLDRSLAYSMWARWPEIECRFDDLTYDNPVLRVIRAALQVTVHVSGLEVLADLSTEVRNRSARLIRRLSVISLVDRATALRLSRGLRLGRAEQGWTAAVSQADDILSDTVPVPTPEDKAAEAYNLSIPTSKLWESILWQALGANADFDVRFSAEGPAHGVAVPAPWRAGGHTSPSRLPDFLVRIPEHPPICVDAKYKTFPNIRPSTDDADQLFAYSHLCTMDGDAVEACALIYPTTPGAGVPPSRRLLRERHADLPLHLIGLPFPGRADVRSTLAWRLYVDHVAAVLQQRLEDLAADITPLLPAPDEASENLILA